MTNLAGMIDDAALLYGNRVAVVDGERRLTFREVGLRAGLLARELAARGIQPGSPVALSCPDVAEFTIAYWAILKAGAVVVPLNVMLRPAEIAYHLDDSQAVAYLVHEGPGGEALLAAAQKGFDLAENCALLATVGASQVDGSTTWQRADLTGVGDWDTVPRTDADTAVIIYTSGTTGRPKGAELSHRNLRCNARAAGRVYEIDPDAPDTYLLVAPLYHSLGQTCIQNAATAYGCTVVMLRRFDAARALRMMLDERVTIFAGVPTMYWAMLGVLDQVAGVDRLRGQLRVAASGGSALPAEIHKEFEVRLGVVILEGYGLTETSPMASSATLGELPRVGSIGRPIAGVEMRLIDEGWSTIADEPDAVGEIAIKGHNVMSGYYRRPEATAESIRDGWFRTGDLATKDADGFYYIVGRSKDLIIRGGFNVYPRELEEVLIEHPAVSMAAVIGVPHISHGQEIKAVVVRRAGHDDVTEEEILRWAKERMAAYKYPRIVEFRSELPMTATGKILKRALS
jgi:long-chain acyl-CoA synthetase